MKTIQTISVFSLILFVAFCLNACKKKDVNQAPTVTVTLPTEGQNFTSGGLLHIQATASDDKELHEMAVRLTRDSDDSLYFSADPAVHELSSYTFDSTIIVPSVSSMANFTLSVEAMDHDNGDTKKTLTIHIMP